MPRTKSRLRSKSKNEKLNPKPTHLLTTGFSKVASGAKTRFGRKINRSSKRENSLTAPTRDLQPRRHCHKSGPRPFISTMGDSETQNI